jgi:hypothetical protein
MKAQLWQVANHSSVANDRKNNLLRNTNLLKNLCPTRPVPTTRTVAKNNFMRNTHSLKNFSRTRTRDNIRRETIHPYIRIGGMFLEQTRTMFTQTNVGSQSFSAVDTRSDQGMTPIWPHAQNPLVRGCARVRALIRGCVCVCVCACVHECSGCARSSARSCEGATARVPGFDCASGWAESAHYRQRLHSVFLRVKLSLIVIFLEH